MKTKPAKPQRIPDHVPGPMEEAALRTFFERGSQQAVDKNRWRAAALASIATAVFMGVITMVVALRQEIYVMQVSKEANGDLQVSGVAQAFTPDEGMKMAWASNYAQSLTEITPAVWRRNVDRVVKMSSGVAVDQVRAYLGGAATNPAALLDKNSLYVREYRRKSVNRVTDNTYLVRYELVSRPVPNAQPSSQSFVMTVTINQVAFKTRDDVFNNPAGLVAVNFSLSEDTGS